MNNLINLQQMLYVHSVIKYRTVLAECLFILSKTDRSFTYKYYKAIKQV